MTDSNDSSSAIVYGAVGAGVTTGLALARLYATGVLTKEDIEILQKNGLNIPSTSQLRKMGEDDIQKTNPQQNENPDASGHLASNATVVEEQSADTPANQKTGPTVQSDHQND